MTPFERLLLIARCQHEDHAFPIHLLREIKELVANAATLSGQEALLQNFATQIENLDSHAGAGCFCD